MNRRLFYIMLPALIATGSAHAVEIYNKEGHKLMLNGRIAGVHHFNNNHRDSDKSYMRFGFVGESQITSDLVGYGEWQYQGQLDHSEPDTANDSHTTRLGFVGLKYGNLGSFDYGRNYGALYDVLSWTDVLYEFGGDGFGVDNYMAYRGNNMATYRNRGLFGLADGLDLALQYQGKNEQGTDGKGRSLKSANGDGYAMSLTYDTGGGVSVGGAMSSSNRAPGQRAITYGGGGGKATAYSGAIMYQDPRGDGGLYLAAMIAQSYKLARFGEIESRKGFIGGFADKARMIEVVAQYQFDFGLRPSLAYVETEGKKLKDYGSQTLRRYLDIGAAYRFNKNMSTFIDYKINLLRENDFTKRAHLNRDNIAAVGLEYQF